MVAQGTPEEVAKVKASYTGQFLAKMLPAAAAAAPRGKGSAKSKAKSKRGAA